MPLLFSYGTLQQPDVQRATFGRLLSGNADRLPRFRCARIAVDDPGVVATSGESHHPIVRFTGDDADQVSGVVFDIGDDELARADDYEVADYTRIPAVLTSGLEAWVYVDRRSALPGSDEPGTPTEEVSYRETLPGDAEVLPPVARAIFVDTFASTFDAEVLRAFCETAYGTGGSMRRDLADPAISWRIAVAANRPIGYVKLRPWTPPSADAAEFDAIELQQIYVEADWHRRGVAEALMGWAVTSARARGAPALYLTVFDHNHRAKRFYTRHGFSEVGHCDFVMGGQVYDDRIWRKPLSS